MNDLTQEIRLSIECGDCDYKAVAPPDIRSVAQAAKDFEEDGWTLGDSGAVCPACSEE